jgi:hypothetical protein
MSYDLCHYCGNMAFKSVPTADGRVINVCRRHVDGPNAGPYRHPPDAKGPARTTRALRQRKEVEEVLQALSPIAMQEPKIRLRSDFQDFYDREFSCLGSVEFVRLSRGGPSRPEMFAQLAAMGYWVPAHGRVRDLNSYPSCMGHMTDGLVIHDDVAAHRGEGKRLVSVGTANCWPDAFAVAYVNSRSSSLRHLVVGRRAFLLRYDSEDDWRSNCGNVRVQVLSELPICDRRGRTEPMFAVDFVCQFGGDGRRWAIDLNVAPGLEGTGIEKLMSPAAVAAEDSGRPLPATLITRPAAGGRTTGL